MTKEDFEQTVDQFKKIIPNVYNAVKKNSDTFFIDQQHGLSYTTANQHHTQDLTRVNSDKDPINFVDNATTKMNGDNATTKMNGETLDHSKLDLISGHQGLMIGRNSQSPNPSRKTLKNNSSQKKL